MQRVNEYQLYELGAQLHPFTEKIEKKKYGDVMFGLYKASSSLRAMLQQNAQVPCAYVAPMLRLY